MLEKCVVLEDKAGAPLVGALLCDLLAVEIDAAGVGKLQPRDQAQQGRLARAARPQQGDKFAGAHFDGGAL